MTIESLLDKAVKAVVKKEKGWEKAIAPPPKGSQAPTRGKGLPASAQQTEGGGGSAFVEDDYTQREYWPAQTLTSSDGLFVLSYQPIRSVLLDDGTRATFKAPS